MVGHQAAGLVCGRAWVADALQRQHLMPTGRICLEEACIPSCSLVVLPVVPVAPCWLVLRCMVVGVWPFVCWCRCCCRPLVSCFFCVVWQVYLVVWCNTPPYPLEGPGRLFDLSHRCCCWWCWFAPIGDCVASCRTAERNTCRDVWECAQTAGFLKAEVGVSPCAGVEGSVVSTGFERSVKCVPTFWKECM